MRFILYLKNETRIYFDFCQVNFHFSLIVKKVRQKGDDDDGKAKTHEAHN